jgi:hypothetical protein
MLRGELSAEPEMVEQKKNGKGARKDVTASKRWSSRGEAGKTMPSLEDEREAGVGAPGDEDDFFGDDSEDEDGSEGEET